jgi:hypothetical protein
MLLGDLTLPVLSGELRERLQERIHADSISSLDEARARRRRMAPAAGLLAAAAALALYLSVTRDPPIAPPGTDPSPPIAHTKSEAPQKELPFERDDPHPQVARDEAPQPAPTSPLRAPAPTRVAVQEPSTPEGADVSPPQETLLDTASDEELALALEFDTIEDLDIIENLKLLEALLILEEGTG